jgi:hypothetical protein
VTTAAGEARQKAIAAHGRAWALLEKPDRTAAETVAMIAAARESLAAWAEVGGPVEAQRGNWLVARVCVDAGEVEAAFEYASRTLALTEGNRATLADFDLAFAEEIAARAWAATGDIERARRHYAAATILGDGIADPEDRAEFSRQFARGPWFGLSG